MRKPTAQIVVAGKSKLTAAEMHAYYIAIVTAPKLVFHRPDVR